MDILADTVFLIDLWRESKSPGAASTYARAHPTQQVGITWIVAGEFLGGAMAAKQDPAPVTAFLARYPLLHSDPAIIRSYAETYARLRARNRLIGPNDLWIAAASIAYGMPLLTRNVDEFRRIGGIEVIDYANNG